MKKGSEYELFVREIQQILIDTDVKMSIQKNITVECNKKIVDNNGITREFDIYWEYEFAGILYRTIIECKDYASKVSVEKIDALLGKIADIPYLTPIFATTQGYQSGAKVKAKNKGIELLVIREQNDDDWINKDGIPYIKDVILNIHMIHPPFITNFSPIFDKTWIEENYEISSMPKSFGGLNTEIFIEDKVKNEKYSLYELQKGLGSVALGYGKQSHVEKFSDAYIIYEEKKYKLLGYKVDFIIFENSSTKIEIDITKQILGIVENIHRNEKKAICIDGTIKKISN